MPLTEGAIAALSYLEAGSALPFHQRPIEDARAGLLEMCRDLSGVPEEVAHVVDREIPGEDGAVKVRIYQPSRSQSGPRAPIIVMMHGGGWVIGDLDTHDGTARALCNAASAVVIAVDYRRSPEHHFPAALHDTLAVIAWTSDNAETLGGDRERLIVAGDSAGGNLAAAAALHARDHGGPPIAGQILVYPALDSRCDSQSCAEFQSGYFLTLEKLSWYWEQYLPPGSDGGDPLMSPSRAEDLSGLPPALILTAEFDPLRDEGEEYARRLSDAGVPARVRRFKGLIHAFGLMAKVIPEAQQAIEECADFIQGLSVRDDISTS